MRPQGNNIPSRETTYGCPETALLFIALTQIKAGIVVIGVVLGAGFDASAKSVDVSATIKLRRLFNIAVLSRLPLGKSTKNS